MPGGVAGVEGPAGMERIGAAAVRKQLQREHKEVYLWKERVNFYKF